MRRIAVLLIACLGGFAALAQPAFATFHLNMVNEVLFASAAGDANVRFVEFLDHGGSEEAFTPVFAPYKLVIYDGAANKLSEQMLDPTGLRGAAASDREYLVSTSAADAAFGVSGDERLTVKLPASAGQACFEANPNPPAFSCLTWGTITKAVPTNSMGTGSAHGPVPPNGQSDQRLSDNSVVAAPPTPKARNRRASTGGTGGGSTTPFTGATFRGRSASVDSGGRAHLRLKCPRGSGGCSGRVTLSAAGGRHARLGSASFSLADGAGGTVTVKLAAAARRALGSRGRTLNARAQVRSRDAAGHSKTTSAAVKLVRK